MGRHAKPCSTRQIRQAVVAAGLTCVAAGAAVLSTTAATAAVNVPLGTYTATLPLNPYPTVSSSSDPSGIGFPITFTNTSTGDGYLLDHVQVTLPTGFNPTGT